MSPRRSNQPAASSMNPELKAVLEKRQSFALVRVVVETYPTKEEARMAMAEVPPLQRGGIVDRDTGNTWASKPCFELVKSALRRVKKAPKQFVLRGPVGRLKSRRTS